MQSTTQSERSWRLQQRAKTVQERMSRNSRSFVRKAVGVPETIQQRSDRREAVEQERANYRVLQRNRSRPSRRSIKEMSSISSKEKRRESARLARDRMDEARDACRHKTSHFHRSNCIRAKLRQLGSRQ